MKPEDILPPQSQTVDAIFNWHKREGDAEPKRGYLGASFIGHECERFLWYAFRQATGEKFDGRMYRLFETGDLEEPRMTEELRGIGCTVVDRNEDGTQLAVNGFGGHFSGHMDASILGLPEAPKTWHIGEFKTFKAEHFRALEKQGLRKYRPKHYAQLQTYMGMTGATRGFYLAKNKDTDELYGERVRFDRPFFEQLMAKAHRVITSNNIPPRLSDRPDWYKCNYCPAKELCHATTSESPACKTDGISCRQCCFATPDTEGEGARWSCDKLGKGLSPEDQGRACERLLYLPGMLDAHSEPINFGTDDHGVDFIDYQVRSDPNSTWRQGGGGGWSGEEVRDVSVSTLTNPLIQGARDQGAVVTRPESTGDVIARYSDMDTCFCSWAGAAPEAAVEWQRMYGTALSECPPLDQDESLDVIAIEYQAREGIKAAVVVDPGCMKAFIMEEKA